MSEDPAFEAWATDRVAEVQELEGLLQERLSDNPVTLVDQLTLIEAWHPRIVRLLAEANTWLDLAEADQLMNIDRELTVLERETKLKARVATQRRTRNLIDGLAQCIRTRIMLGMSLRKAHTAETFHHAT